jgi:PadR family transcriptional regulator, regulatory protein PadR
MEEIEPERMANIGPVEQHVLLAIIALNPDAYGVSIQDHIQKRAGYRPSIGSIYAALDRLETKGFVKSRQGESTRERGGRAKLYFTITAPGQAALKGSLREISSLRRGLRWIEAFRRIEVTGKTSRPSINFVAVRGTEVV